MKEKINPMEYANHIMQALRRGILLNTNGEKFNSMVIGWGHLGCVWSEPTFVVYVREGRYTRPQLDSTREFTVSVPLDKPDPEINRVCGSLSGRDVDKASAAKLTLVPAEKLNTPAVAQYPLTLECQVLYSQRQDLDALPESIRRSCYPPDVDSFNPMSNRDPHIMYIGKIVDAYIIRQD